MWSRRIPMPRTNPPVKAFLVGAALVALVAATLAGAGCGGDISRARSYTEAGDEFLESALEIGEDLDLTKSRLERLMLENDVAGLVAMEAGIRGILEEIDRSMEFNDKAMAEYRRVGRLEGVDKYAVYAGYRMEAAAKQKEALETGRELGDYALDVLEAAAAGRPVNLNESLKAVSSKVNELDQNERDLDEFMRQAEAYAHDHKL